MYFVWPLELIYNGVVTNAVNDTTNYPSWTYPTSYSVNDTVFYAYHYYKCISAHTSAAVDPPDTNTDEWEQLKIAHKFAIFEPALDYVATGPTLTALTYEIPVSATDGAFNTIALLNLDTKAVRVQIEDDSNPGTYYYDNTFDMVDDSMISDYYDWFFTPAATLYKKDLYIFDLPPYPAGATVHLTIGDATQTSTVGVVIIGLCKYVGKAQYGSTLSFSNSDTTQEDADFSSAIINTRNNIDKYNYNVLVQANRVQYIKNLFGSLGSSPTLFYVTQSNEELYCYGFYKSFDVNFVAGKYSGCTLQAQKFALKPVQDYYPIR